MSENMGLEVSWSTDLSPTATFSCMSEPARRTGSRSGGGGVYPGWWGSEGPGGCYTGTHPYTLPGPIFNLFPGYVPTHGQMKAF